LLPDFKQVKVFPFTTSFFPTFVHLAPCLMAALAGAEARERVRQRTDKNVANFLSIAFIILFWTT
jgi:hypothetical protein